VSMDLKSRSNSRDCLSFGVIPARKWIDAFLSERESAGCHTFEVDEERFRFEVHGAQSNQ
jgi:hypothetical protein